MRSPEVVPAADGADGRTAIPSHHETSCGAPSLCSCCWRMGSRGQAPAAACPSTIAWDLDPSHDLPRSLWELEIDGVGANPCGRVGVTATERRCHGFITPGRGFRGWLMVLRPAAGRR